MPYKYLGMDEKVMPGLPVFKISGFPWKNKGKTSHDSLKFRFFIHPILFMLQYR